MTSEIIILYEPEQIETVLSYFGREKLREGKLSIIALEYEVELLLKKEGISYHSIQKYLKPDSLKHIHKEASLFLEKWYNSPELDFFQHSGIHLLKTKGPHLLHYLKEILYYLEILFCLFDNNSEIKKLWIPQSGISLPTNAEPVVLFAYRIPVDIIKLWGEKENISVSVLPYNKQQFATRRLRSKVRQIITILFEQVLKIINFIISITQPPKKIKILVIDHWHNIKSFIGKMNDVELIMMERKSIKEMKWQIFKKRARFYHPKDFFTSNIKKIAINRQAEFRSQWQKLENNPKLSEIFCYKGISFWSLIRQLLDCLILKDSKEVVCEIEGIKLILDTFSINRVLLRAASRDNLYITAKLASNVGIPSIELQHGLVNSDKVFVYYSPVKVDYFAAYGKLTKKILVENGNDSQRIIKIGSPRFDNYSIESYDPETLEELRTKLKIDTSRPVILFIPPAIRNPIKSRDCNSYEAVRIFKTLANFLTEIPDTQIIFKLRPVKMNIGFFKKIIREIFKGKVIIAQYEPIKALLYLSDVVISCRSTVVIESMIIGKPVVLYTIRGENAQFQLFEEAGAIRIAKALKDLLPEVRSLILNKELRKSITRKAKDFLEENYSFDGKSSLRLIKLLREKN